MTTKFITELFQRRDKEIKELVIQTMATCMATDSAPTLQHVSQQLQSAFSIYQQEQVHTLSEQILALKAEVQESRANYESNNTKIEWIRHEYEKVMEEQRFTYETRIQELEKSHERQCQEMMTKISQLKTRSAQFDRLRKIADMVPELIKQFDEEKLKLRTQFEQQMDKQKSELARKWKGILNSIREQILQVKGEVQKVQQKSEGENLRKSEIKQRGRMGREDWENWEGKKNLQRISYYQSLIRNFQSKLKS